MGYWIKQREDSRMPDYLKDNLHDYCDSCGAPMLNYYNDDLRCTNRRCSNPKCPAMMAAKGAFVCKLLEVKGIGPATCLKYIEDYGLTHHIQILKFVDGKPTIPLHTYLRLHCFEGVDNEWEVICKKLSIYTLDELFVHYDGKHLELLNENKEILYENLEYVNLEERPSDFVTSTPKRFLTIMITGTPNQFDSKEHFINVLNAAAKGKITLIHQKTARQSGVDFLIREPGSATRGKLTAAQKGGIPIVTSAEFMTILTKMLEKL